MSLFTHRRIPHVLYSVLILASAAMLQGCLHDNDSTPAPTYGIGGTVSGLIGTLVLQNNGSGDLSITTNGDFSFGTGFADSTSYAVTVLTKPSEQGCKISNSSGSVSAATVSNITVTCVNHANPTGYYDETGTANVDDGSGGVITITDLQAMVSGNRLMMLSMTEGVVYDGTMTIIGEDYTATLTIYKNGVKSTTSTVEGIITATSYITGNLTGTGYGSGNFQINYPKTTNGMASAIPRIDINSGHLTWTGSLSGSTASHQVKIETTGTWPDFDNPSQGTFNNCNIIGVVSTVVNSSLYNVLMEIQLCGVKNGATYSGFSATQTTADTTLVVIFTNGEYAGYGEYQ